MSNTLTDRLHSVRRRLRQLAWIRGFAWTVMAALLLLAVSGLIDWTVHASSGLRVLMLSAVVAGVGFAIYRYLVAPLSIPLRDLDLALRWEHLHPESGETISSALEFSRTPTDDPYAGSIKLRERVVEAGLRQADLVEASDVVAARPIARISALSGATVFGVLALATAAPLTTKTAVARLFDPFGEHPWPKRTTIELLEARDRIAKGDAFGVGVKVSGITPSAVKLQFRFQDGRTTTAEEMRQEGDGLYRGGLEAAVQPFSYAITAGDDRIEWRPVEVVPAPEEFGLKLKVHFPAYTNLPP